MEVIGRKQYVIGNDITDICFSIYAKHDLPEDFSDALDLTVFAINSVYKAVSAEAHVTVQGNKLSLVFMSSDMRKAGVYDLVCEYKKPDPSLPGGVRNKRVVNCSAIELVEKSCELDLPDDPLVIEGIVDSLRGYSSYEVAVRNGFTGTEEEFVASLKQPALDAAAVAISAADKAMSDVNSVVGLLSDAGMLSYGIEFDTTVENPVCVRIGNPDLHRIRPIQSRMRRCLLLDDGTVNHYLHPDDSAMADTGFPADLSGASGQVMVEIPDHYRRFEADGTKRRCHLSTVAIPGFHHVPKYYVSAYEATVERGVNRLSSVVNTTTGFRGGNNNASWDDTYRSLLGMPATAISLTNFRTYARNRGAGWNCNLYEAQKTISWLYFVEYANLNCKLAFNPLADASGYRQGGLGPGVTTLASADWTAYNSQYPIIPCGTTNSLGDNTGVVPFTLPAEYPVPVTVQVPSYRGIENVFGHVWKWTDGIKCRMQADDSGGLSEFYVCDNPMDFQDTIYNGYELRGLLPRANGYVKEIQFGEWGDIMALLTGASSSTYFSVYFYTSLPAAGEAQRGVRFGGSSLNGAGAGLVCADTTYAPSHTLATLGSRLCFLSA